MTITVAAYPGRVFHGKVKRIGASMKAQSRALPIEIEVPNDEGSLKPGSFARAQIALGAGDAPALLVPKSAIGTSGSASRVFVRVGNRVSERIVAVGREVEGLTEIRGTLTAADEIAIDAVDKLSDGAEVKVIPEVRRSEKSMQWLAAICVRRPVFASVIVLILSVVGLFSYFGLGLDRFPKIDFPNVTVVTVLPGSAPEEVETEITDKIEAAVNTISGIDELRSTSVEGVSQVILTFVIDKDINLAAQEVRDKVSAILGDLPPASTSR